MARVLFSPCNQLTHEIRERASEIYGTPSHAHFPRWWNRGSELWLESSSGSRTLTVRFDTGEIIVPAWKDGGRTEQMPAHWSDMYLGSLFDAADGSALDPAAFEAASAHEGWKAARR